MNDVERKIERLTEKWGYLEISIHPGWEDNPVTVRNHTDEGLGADKRLWTRGETVEQAIDYALDGLAVCSYTEHAPWEEQ